MRSYIAVQLQVMSLSSNICLRCTGPDDPSQFIIDSLGETTEAVFSADGETESFVPAGMHMENGGYNSFAMQPIWGDSTYISGDGATWQREMQDMGWLNSFPFDMHLDVMREDIDI